MPDSRRGTVSVMENLVFGDPEYDGRVILYVIKGMQQATLTFKTVLRYG
jgi:hypothetical protein